MPIALILTLLGHMAVTVWWAATLSGRVEDHSRRIVSLEATDQRVATEAQKVAETLARLDERMVQQTEILREIRARLAR